MADSKSHTQICMGFYMYIHTYIQIYMYIRETVAYFNLLLIAIGGSCTNTLNFKYTNNILRRTLPKQD
jgi:hypothetical protein